ncbi:unnamed protein product, partial [Hapterophycus canaliculatus]
MYFKQKSGRGRRARAQVAEALDMKGGCVLVGRSRKVRGSPAGGPWVTQRPDRACSRHVSLPTCGVDSSRDRAQASCPVGSNDIYWRRKSQRAVNKNR